MKIGNWIKFRYLIACQKKRLAALDMFRPIPVGYGWQLPTPKEPMNQEEVKLIEAVKEWWSEGLRLSNDIDSWLDRVYK